MSGIFENSSLTTRGMGYLLRIGIADSESTPNWNGHQGGIEKDCNSDTIRPWLSHRQREVTVYRGRKGVRISRDPASASWRDGMFLAGPVEEKVGNSGGCLFLEEVLSRAVGSL